MHTEKKAGEAGENEKKTETKDTTKAELLQVE